MKRYYKLSSGEVIPTWYNDIGILTIMTNEGMDKETLEFDHRSNDPTVDYHGEIIHLNNFEFTPLDKLIEKVEKSVAANDRWGVMSEEALATIMQESENIGFVMDVECFDTLIPCMGIGMKSNDKTIKCLMVPFEDQWKKDDWHYKIELRPYEEALRPLVGRETMYFSDFWSMVMCDKRFIQVVDLRTFDKSSIPDQKIKMPFVMA